MCASGAAPISKQTLEFFMSLNLPIMEVYGMTETTGKQINNLVFLIRVLLDLQFQITRFNAIRQLFYKQVNVLQ